MLDFSIAHYSLEYFLFGVAVMMIVSVLASKASSWVGVPSLLLFLGVGMLAGSEGPGGIEFTNYSLAFVIGSVSLVFILFDGGMETSWKETRPVVKTGVSLASLGVLFTCLSIGAFAHFLFKLDWPEALLLGAIVSSTDAAAVFSILRSKNLSLKGSLKSTLEFEAGSNDPMAIFLTVSFIQLISLPEAGFGDFLLTFFLQSGVGLALGYTGGKVSAWLFNNVKIDYDGLYTVFLVSLVLLIFSLASLLGGSGFLAVYVAGLVLGNSNILRKQTLNTFKDGVAWIAQITVFLVLGLLVFPSHVLEVWKEGLLLSLFMMFIARPVSAFLATPINPFNKRERIFLSWIGLRGAAPVILAILPLASELPNAKYFFNIVFFVVVFSVFLQAPTIPWLADKLGVSETARSPKAQDKSFLPRGFVAMNLIVTEAGAAQDQKVVDLQLPVGVLLTSLEREGRFSIPRGDTVLQRGDRVVALGRPSCLHELETLFGEGVISDHA